MLALHPLVVSRSIGRMFLESYPHASLLHGLCRIFPLGVLHQALWSLAGAHFVVHACRGLFLYGSRIPISVGQGNDGAGFGSMLAILRGEHRYHGLCRVLIGQQNQVARNRYLWPMDKPIIPIELCHLFCSSHYGFHLAWMVGRDLEACLHSDTRAYAGCLPFLVCGGMGTFQIAES